MIAFGKMLVYRQETRNCDPLERPGVDFAEISEGEMRAMRQLPEDIFARQVDRLRRFGSSYCHGAYLDGNLAAFAWLIPHDLMPRDVPFLLSGRPGEAELTAAETMPRYRGLGLYGFILRNVFWAARERGFHTVLFKTSPGNAAALRSFEKIGAKCVGTTYYCSIPGRKSPLAWPRRFR